MTSEGLLSPSRKSIKLMPWKSSPRPSTSTLPSTTNSFSPKSKKSSLIISEDESQPQLSRSLSTIKTQSRPSGTRRSLLFKKKVKKDFDLSETVESISKPEESPNKSLTRRNRQRSLSLLDASRPQATVGGAETTQDGIKALSRNYLKAMEEIGDLVCRKLEGEEGKVENGNGNGNEEGSSSLSSSSVPDLSSSSSNESFKSNSYNSHDSSFNSSSDSSGLPIASESSSIGLVLPSSIKSDSLARSYSKARNRASKSITGASIEDYRRWYSDEPLLLLPGQDKISNKGSSIMSSEGGENQSNPTGSYFDLIPIYNPDDFNPSSLLPSTPLPFGKTLTSSLPPPPTSHRKSKSRTKSMSNMMMLSSKSNNDGTESNQTSLEEGGGGKRASRLIPTSSDSTNKVNNKRSVLSDRPVRIHGRKNSRDLMMKLGSTSSSPTSNLKEITKTSSSTRNRSRPSTSSGISISSSSRPPNPRKLSAGHTPPVPNYDFEMKDSQIQGFKIKNRKRSKSDTLSVSHHGEMRKAFNSLSGLGLELDVDNNEGKDDVSSQVQSRLSEKETLSISIPPLPFKEIAYLKVESHPSYDKNNRLESQPFQKSNSPFMTPTFGSNFSPLKQSSTFDDGRSSVFNQSDDEEED